MTVSVTTKIELDGPFFRRDPGKTLYTNIGQMLDELVGELESKVQGVIEGNAGAMPFYTGWSAKHTKGYRTSPVTGKHWSTWGAVAAFTGGMSATDAIRTKAAAATIEQRFHPYRQAKSAVYRTRALISADLTRGLE